MRRLYLRAGLYAEGPTDYYFLCRLLNRLLEDRAAARFPGAYDVEDTLGIDAPTGVTGPRERRIVAAVQDRADEMDLLVVHSDGAGDPDKARATCVQPGIDALRAAGLDLAVVACVPVRELEAWMLSDERPFQELLGRVGLPQLPADPEKERDPKATLRALLGAGGVRRDIPYELFGELLRLDSLRRLPAFHRFERDLDEALTAVARAQGLRPPG